MNRYLFTVLVFLCLLIAGCGGGGGSSSSPPPPPPVAQPDPEPEPEEEQEDEEEGDDHDHNEDDKAEPGEVGDDGLVIGAAVCESGTAGSFSCNGVDLRARVPHTDMNATTGNDLWAWVDPLTNEEYAVVGTTTGTSFVRVTDPEDPEFLGDLPTVTTESAWRDIKVMADHAYIVADGSGAHGMQVFDLTRLRDVTTPLTFVADFQYVDIENTHNIAVNESSGFIYAVGTNTCNEGLHMIDATTAINPMFAGCYDIADIHDTQCVDYIGPDTDHAGKELCFNSANNGSAALDIADVTDKNSPVRISSIGYPDSGFAHQGWLTEDHRFFLLGDELDERDLGFSTRTHVFDVQDLDAPQYLYAFEATTASIDHNLYVSGNRVFQANYTSGLRVLEFGDLAAGEISEIAHFDTYPASDSVSFSGAWTVYPWLPSGNILVNDRSNGLFILTLVP